MNRSKAGHRRPLQKFEDSLDDDLNTAEALGAIFEYVRDVNTSMEQWRLFSPAICLAP